MANLLDSIKEYAAPALISQSAKQFDEKEGGIAKAFSALASTILAGILNKAGDLGAMSRIFHTLKNFDIGVLHNLDSLLDVGNLAHDDPRNASGHLLGTLFGAKVPAITNTVAAFSGTKPSTVSSLLGLVGPLVMGVLSRKINVSAVTVPGFANLMLSEKNDILGTLPTGLASVIDLTPDLDEDIKAVRGRQWVLPLLLLLGLGGGIIFYLKSCA